LDDSEKKIIDILHERIGIKSLILREGNIA
jgi:hypothetical protein